MRALLGVLLLSVLAFAGCLGGSDGEPAPSASATPTGASTSPTATPSPTTAPEPNRAPTASLEASSAGGPVPLNVSFTLDAADLDGGDFSWSFDADGDGTMESGGASADLPTNVSFTYQAAGTYTARFDVTDGEAAANRTLVLNITAAAAAEPFQQVHGNWVVGAVGCPHNQVGVFEERSASELAAGADVLWGYFEVDPATHGLAWELFSLADTSLFVELDFFDTGGAYMEYTSGDAGATLTGTVPADAGYAFVFPCGAGPGEFGYLAGTSPG